MTLQSSWAQDGAALDTQDSDAHIAAAAIYQTALDTENAVLSMKHDNARAIAQFVIPSARELAKRAEGLCVGDTSIR